MQIYVYIFIYVYSFIDLQKYICKKIPLYSRRFPDCSQDSWDDPWAFLGILRNFLVILIVQPISTGVDCNIMSENFLLSFIVSKWDLKRLRMKESKLAESSLVTSIKSWNYGLYG